MELIQTYYDNWIFKSSSDLIEAVNAELNNVKQSSFKIGMYLSEAYVKRINNGTGIDDFFEWCELTFDLGKSSVYNLMRIYNVFHDPKRTDIGVIDSKYEGFSQSQLVELLPVADDLHCLTFIKPTDPVSKIRKVVKIHKKNRFRKLADCESSDEYIGRFGASILSGDNSIKKDKLKGSEAFNAVYNYLTDYFKNSLKVEHCGGSISIMTRNIVFNILDL